MKQHEVARYAKGTYPFFESSGTWQVISGRRYPLRPHVLFDPEKCSLMVGLLRGANDKKVGKRLRRKLTALAFAMALSVVLPGFVKPAKAATYTATCLGTVGNVSSLISAINSANTNPGADTVNVGGPGCVYNLTTVDNWWYGPNGLPPIASDITIEGNGSTIQRDGAAPKLRFFYVGADPVGNPLSLGFNTPDAGKLTLHNMTLKDGWQQGSIGGSGGAGMGGAIFNQGKVVLDGVTFTGNYAQGGVGGYGSNGGGMGSAAGFGGSVTPAGSSGYNGVGNFGMSGGNDGLPAGGGGGFGASDNATGFAGGGTQNGLGGNGGGGTSWPSGAGGNGSGGGNYWSGGGGVGGGGTYGYGGGGGGGFGGGGGCTGGGWGIPAGNGGFGGGGGCGGMGGAGSGGAGGFGGGTGGDNYGGGGAGFGGAILNHVGDITISNSTFSSNSATGGSSLGNGGSGFGAALFNLNGTVKITKSTITGNSVAGGSGAVAGSAGGAVYNLGYDGNLSPHATVAISSDTVISGTTGGGNKVNNRPAEVSGGLTNKATASIIVPPNAPSGIVAKAISPTQIDLSWKDNSTNETGFKIERRAGNCDPGNINPWAQIGTKAANVVLFPNTGLTANTTYSYRIRAYNLAGNSSYSGCAFTATSKTGTPNSPSGLTATSASSGKINLSWKDNSTDETGFKIYRKTGAGAWTLLTPTPLPSGVIAYGDSTAAGNDASNSYSYYIVACNASGCSPSTYAASVPFRPTVFAAAPAAGNIGLTWTDNSSNETGFQVYKKTGTCSGAGIWALRTTTVADAESYNDTAVTTGKTYSYKTRAYYRSAGQPYANGYSMFTGCVEAIVP